MRPAAAPRPIATAVLGSVCLGASVLATALGADAARAPSTTRETAERAVREGLAAGPSEPGVAARLRELRARLGARPLDARTRVAYAAALADLAGGSTGGRAALFHAERAVAAAPVTAPVVVTAARAMTAAGRSDEAATLVRSMFGWAPRQAAELLVEIERYAGASVVTAGLPEEPGAHLAWARALRHAGRASEAGTLVDDALRRWPDSSGIREAAASDAIGRRDDEALRRAVPPNLPFVVDETTALLLAYRGRSRATAGDVAGARDDAAGAVAIAEDRRAVLGAAAGTFEAIGDLDAARSTWSRVLFTLPQDGRSLDERARVLAALARIEERAGRSGDALRYWREVVSLVPEHEAARRRIEALTTGR